RPRRPLLTTSWMTASGEAPSATSRPRPPPNPRYSDRDATVFSRSDTVRQRTIELRTRFPLPVTGRRSSRTHELTIRIHRHRSEYAEGVGRCELTARAPAAREAHWTSE